MSKSFISTFFYDCEMSFNDKDNTAHQILKECIKYILVSHDYKNRIMPIVYVKINIPSNLYNMMVPQQGIAKIYLSIGSYRNTGSTSSITKDVFRGEFDYYMTDDPNAYQILDQADTSGGGNVYKSCTIGLLRSNIVQQNQRSFGGVYKNTNTLSLVQAATSEMRMVIQAFVNNMDLPTFTCPPITTVGQFINYMNSYFSFYNGSYMYYMDFDKTYLISNDGSYIDIKDNDFRYVAFDVQDLTKYQSLATGMVEDSEQDAYIIYINGNDAKVITDRVSPDLGGVVTAINVFQDTQDVSMIDTSAITNITTNMNANIIINSADPNAASNVSTIVAENSNTLVVTKADMDTRIFTPNKQYMLCYYQDNPKYCGLYYLVAKTEIYLLTGSTLKNQTTLVLNKCADFVDVPRKRKNKKKVSAATARRESGGLY